MVQFTPFLKLPLEIRTLIWSYSISPPRMMHLRYDQSVGINQRSQNDVWIVPGARPPGGLSACYESRHVLSKIYTYTFQNLKSCTSGLQGAGTWFDLERDILCLPWEFCNMFPESGMYRGEVISYFSQALGHDIQRLQHAAILGAWGPNSTFLWMSSFVDGYGCIGIDFRNLERIILISPCHFDHRHIPLEPMQKPKESGMTNDVATLSFLDDTTPYDITKDDIYERFMSREGDWIRDLSYPRLEVKTPITEFRIAKLRTLLSRNQDSN